MNGKTLSFALALALAASLAGCSKPAQQGNAEDAEATAAVEEQATEETAPETTEESDADKKSDSDEKLNTEKKDAEKADQEKDAASSPNAAIATGDYIDFDEMRFYLNGKKYVLGVNTLQDMIDDGVPFDENDLANAGNNLNPNYQSQGFVIELADYYNAQVYTMNDSEDNKTIAECTLCEIYLPVRNDLEQNILSFDFPLDITMDELIATCGEPDENTHWVSEDDETYYTDTIVYKRDSEKYLGHSDYRFEFTKGELKYVYINYVP